MAGPDSHLRPLQANPLGNGTDLRWVPLPTDVATVSLPSPGVQINSQADNALIMAQLCVVAELLRIRIHEQRMMHVELLRGRSFFNSKEEGNADT